MLPVEPKSLVEQYLEGKERPSKEQVVASRKSRFSKPALPAITERQSAKKPCACQGKCATKNAVVGVKISCATQNAIVKLRSVKIVSEADLYDEQLYKLTF